jgi:hypothetical protein
VTELISYRRQGASPTFWPARRGRCISLRFGLSESSLYATAAWPLTIEQCSGCPLRDVLGQRRAGRWFANASLRSCMKPEDTVRKQLREYVPDWQGLLRGNVHQAQQVLRRLIKDRLTFVPNEAGHYTFSGVGTVRRLLEGVVRKLASPTGFGAAGALRRSVPQTGETDAGCRRTSESE